MDNKTVVEDLTELTIALASERKIETILELVIEAVLRHSMAEGAAIFALDTMARHLHCVSARFHGVSDASRSCERVPIYLESHTPNLTEPVTFSVSTGTVVNLANIDVTPGYDFSRIRREDEVRGLNTRSLVVVPFLIQANQCIGVLQLTNPCISAGRIDKLDERLLGPLRGFAAHAAMAVWKARLLEENSRLNRRYGDHVDKRPRNKNPEAGPAKQAMSGPARLIGDSPPLERAVELVRRAAKSTVPILVRGETGTGKELMASLIHNSSGRAQKPFVVQNCAALPETLLESELFGHVKGAFTGAANDKPGLVHEAHNGTLFLDEIGDMPLSLQAKILRLLQEGEVRRVGSTKTENVDVRIVGATNSNMEQQIEAGEFRQDLFYRLNVFPITLPPLRERPSDIPKLIDHLLSAAAGRAGRAAPEISPGALERLMCWSYPGNVRELKNILERAVLMVDREQPISVDHLPAELAGLGGRKANNMPDVIPEGDLKTIVGRYEALVIEAKMRETNWNMSHAARCLQVSRRTIVDKVNRYKITRHRPSSRHSEERL
jgi:transcriptional regulator with GAF, ATPase, and Fis domain